LKVTVEALRRAWMQVVGAPPGETIGETFSARQWRVWRNQ
jgi:hypothetical protein